jgi:hypothetical protein
VEVAVTVPLPESDEPWWELPIQRPSSVTAAGAILWVLAGLAALGVCAFAVLANNPEAKGNGQALVLLAILLAVIGIVDGVLAYNVLRGRQWARIVAIAFGALNIVSGCISIGLQATIIGLLMTTAAGAYFRNPG